MLHVHSDFIFGLPLQFLINLLITLLLYITFGNRRQPKNMILAGLWFDSKKPPMHMYLKPIFHMLLDLEKTGLLCINNSSDHFMHAQYTYRLSMEFILPLTLYL